VAIEAHCLTARPVRHRESLLSTPNGSITFGMSGVRIAGVAALAPAFYAGCETINRQEFDYLCKLNLDLDLPPRYFQRLVERMESEPRLATCSGKPFVRGPGGRLLPEPCGDEMSVGMTKLPVSRSGCPASGAVSVGVY